MKQNRATNDDCISNEFSTGTLFQSSTTGDIFYLMEYDMATGMGLTYRVTDLAYKHYGNVIDFQTRFHRFNVGGEIFKKYFKELSEQYENK